MIDPKKGALSAMEDEQEPILPGDPSTPDDSPEHEGAESQDLEASEGKAEGGEDPEAAEAPDPKAKELFDLVVARTMDALARAADDLDKALKADPVRATVEMGTAALRAIAQSADDAGKPIPFEVLVQAGMQTIKELGAIANEKGYLPDEQIESFLKEAFQQSLVKYARMDMSDGKIDQETMEKIRAGRPAAPEAGGAGALAAAGGA